MTTAGVVWRRKFGRVPERTPGPPPPVMFSSEHHDLATPVRAEVYVSRLLDRDQFRRHCDRYRTREAILRNLE